MTNEVPAVISGLETQETVSRQQFVAYPRQSVNSRSSSSRPRTCRLPWLRVRAGVCQAAVDDPMQGDHKDPAMGELSRSDLISMTPQVWARSILKCAARVSRGLWISARVNRGVFNAVHAAS